VLEPASGPLGRGLAALHRFARQAQPGPRERCELCAAPIPPEHRHLLEVAARNVECVCRPCALLFDREAASLGKYRLIPERRLRLRDFRLSEEGWKALGIPVGLAYFAYSTPLGQVMTAYPGPAGAVEADVEPACWEALLESNPVLRTLEPDVEALLVDRGREARRYLVVPIDECYRLVGVFRRHWRGLTGGTEVWEEVRRFLTELEERCVAPREGADSCG